MKATELIQILMRDENIDKDIQIVERKPLGAERGWRPAQLDVVDVKDFGINLELMVDLPEPEVCDERHCTHNYSCDCDCDCDYCERCEYR